MSSVSIIYILVYVDDLIITGTHAGKIQQFITQLHTTFALKDLSDLHYFLGLQIRRSPAGLTLSQEKYIHDILCRNNMTEASSISTPANPTSHLTSRGDPFHDPKLFRKIVGSLQYVVNRVNLCILLHLYTGRQQNRSSDI